MTRWSKMFLPSLLALFCSGSAVSTDSLDEKAVLSAMKKAADFMLNDVSNGGGFVSLYTEDLSEQWGEVPARKSMIWVQDPGTVGVGNVLLASYKATGDAYFLEQAKKVAGALIFGQHPSGGWHYFVDFDPEGIEKWYEEVGSNCWGWEEFYHFCRNCTFDDHVTIGAAEFLLDLYVATLDPEYRVPLEKAIGFVLESQYPRGGWPQRYPPCEDRSGEAWVDYTAYYTYNDGVIIDSIFFLLKADESLGNDECREAALRGMDFVILSQLGTPQAGWAQQYDMNLRPAAARSYEPAGLSPSETAANIRYLLTFYKIAGDRKYLRGIPDALSWLDSAKLPPGHSDQGHTHAQFVEVGTDRPLYAHREGSSRRDGRYWVDYTPANFPGHYGMQMKLDVAPLRKEYERVFALTPEEARAEYQKEKSAQPAVPVVSAETIQGLVDSMNEKGAWIEDLSAPDYTDWKFKPSRHFRGISTRTFTNNMNALLYYLKQGDDGR